MYLRRMPAGRQVHTYLVPYILLPNIKETAEQTAPITPNAMSGFFAGSNTPNNAGSVIPTTAIKQDDIAVVFKRIIFRS